MTREEWIQKLKNEGYQDLAVHSFGPNVNFGEHTHPDETVHVVLEGELIITDKHGVKILKPGEQFPIPKDTTHTVRCGPDGCTFIVGVKK